MFPTLNFKIVAVGESATGKTSLIYKYIKGEFRLDYNVTLGVEFYTKTQMINKEKIQLQIWDTAGQEAYRSIVKTFYKGSSAILLVFALNDKKSFTQLEYWVKQAKDNINPQALVFLIGTKLDLNQKAISRQQINTFLKFVGKGSYFQISSKTGQNVQELFTTIGTQLYNKYKADKQFREYVNPRDQMMEAYLQNNQNTNNKQNTRNIRQNNRRHNIQNNDYCC